VQKGLAPEKIQAICDSINPKRRIRRFLSVDGICNAGDAVKPIGRSSGRGESRIRLRNFHGGDEILHYKNQTYLLSNQWGPETHQTLKALANALHEYKITITGVSGTE
jgi:hypothetical protein